MTDTYNRVGVVIIGRNEGERLRRCLRSIVGKVNGAVYVDSGSSDGSIGYAREVGIETVALDMSLPFCAARARNVGFDVLVAKWPTVEYVQFVDGDCEIFDSWLLVASAALEKRIELAAVAGYLRERSPEVSIYNQIGEMEWNHLGSGDVGSVGGIFMIRCTAFVDVGGFDPSVSAGEEPELCHRLSAKGWIISRLDVEMAWHDLAMTSFRQWWKRQVRGGYGALDVTRRFGLLRFKKHVLRARFWCTWPLSVAALWWVGGGLVDSETGCLLGLIIFSIWPVQFSRIFFRTLQSGHNFYVAFFYSLLTMVSYVPQMQGQFQYMVDRFFNRCTRLIEYKKSSGANSER